MSYKSRYARIESAFDLPGYSPDLFKSPTDRYLARKMARYSGYKRKRSYTQGPVAKRRRYTKRRARSRNPRSGGFLGIEKKFYDTAQNVALATATGATGGEIDPTTVDCISAPAQGDGEENRDGNRIVIKSAFVTGVIKMPKQANQTATDDAFSWVVYLVQDQQANGATINSEDVFTNPAASNNTASTPLRNLQYTSRFKVLAKSAGTFDAPSPSYDGTNMEQGGMSQMFVLSWKGIMPVQFKGGATAAGVTGVANNAIHVVAWVTSTDMAPTIAYNARVRFEG